MPLITPVVPPMSFVASGLRRILVSRSASSVTKVLFPASSVRVASSYRMASTLPKLPVFEAIARHDPESTVVIHSGSGRRFKYGELLGDVCKTRNKLYEKAGKTDMNGDRVAFLVENSYDYVGKPT